MKKSVFLISSVFLASIGLSLSLVFVKSGVDFRINAKDEYTCELPTGYSEISDVIDYLADHPTGKSNPYTFRGTVTNIDDTKYYVQRVDQTTLELEGICISDPNGYTNVEVGNVIDISGGYLHYECEQPTLIINGANQVFTSFDENPYGYGPRRFESFDEFFHGSTAPTYPYSSLIELHNVKPINAFNYTYDDVTYYILYLQDCFSLEYFNAVVKVSDLDAVKQVLSAAANAKHAISFTGTYINMFGDNPGFLITDYNTVSDDGSYYDADVIQSARSSSFNYGYGYEHNFVLYNLKGKADIPYVEFGDFYYAAMSIFYNQTYVRLNRASTSDPDTFAYYMENYPQYMEIQLDAANDIIDVTKDPLGFLSIFNSTGPGSRYFVNGLETQYCLIDEDKSETLAPRQETVYRLGDYNMDIVKDKYNNMYVPLPTLCNILLTDLNASFAFNGNYMFYASSLTDSNFRNEFYESSAYKDQTTRSEEFAEYTFNDYAFSLEHFYGLREYKIPAMSSIYDVFDSYGITGKLLSLDTYEFEETVADFTCRWMADGHANYYFPSAYASQYVNELRSIGLNYTPARNARVAKLYADMNEISNLSKEAGSEVGLEMIDNTAIIRFDSFVKYTGNTPSGQLNLDDYSYTDIHNMGSDLLFRKAFNDIEANSDIENVIVDLTCNGGGMIDSLPFLEAYFTDEVTLTNMNNRDGEIIRTAYKVDINYDGQFNENDTYKGKYNFFLLTSNFSFSCGNAYPTIAQEKGMMTIIGERSGGGECAVGFFATANGIIFRSSSNAHMGIYDDAQQEFIGNDDGIEVDYSYPRDKFYDRTYLTNFVNNLL